MADPEFTCACGYKAADLTKAMAHARNTGHSLVRPVDDEDPTK